MNARNNVIVKKVTIANGTSLSPGVDLEGGELIGFLTPAAWTAAGLSFLSTADPRSGTGENKGAYGTGTYVQVVDDAAAVITVATGTVATANALVVRSTILNKLKGLQHLKLQSGTVAAAVSQGADRDFYLLIAPQP